MIVKKCLPHQAAFLQAPYIFKDIRFFFDICGYAAGKTSCLGDSILKAVDYFQGKKDKEGKNPKIGVCGITLTFLQKTLTGSLEQTLRNTKSAYRFDKKTNIIYIGNVELHLTPIENEGEIFGFDWCACFVDELDELPTHTCIAVVKALNDRCRQALKDETRSPFLAFTTTSQGLKGTYQTIMNFRKIGMSYMIVRGRTRDNIYLQKEYVEAMYKMYNEKETKCLLEGEFISIDSGLVFPDYNPAFNKLNIDMYDNIEETETVYIGQDFNRGFNKAVACVVRNKNVYVIKTYSFEDVRSAPEVFRYDFPYNSIIWVPDMTYKDHFGDFARELKAYKIRIAYRKCNPNIVSRNFAINKMFYARRLFLCDFASDLDNALLTHQKDPKTGLPMKGQGESAPDHLTDSLAYVVAHLIGWRRELKDVYDVTMGRALKRHKEIGNEYEDDEDGVNAIDITKEVPV